MTAPNHPPPQKREPQSKDPSSRTDVKNNLTKVILRHLEAGIRCWMLCFSVELHCAALTLVSQLVVQLVNSNPQVNITTTYPLILGWQPFVEIRNSQIQDAVG